MFCHTCRRLIQGQQKAVAQFHHAVVRLSYIAGKKQTTQFAAAAQECAAYREECRQNRSALQAHKKTHPLISVFGQAWKSQARAQFTHAERKASPWI